MTSILSTPIPPVKYLREEYWLTRHLSTDILLAMTTFGERLKWAREQAALSGRQLGEDCEVSNSLVGQIERGEVESTSAAIAARMAKRLGLRLDWLVSGEGPRWAK